MTIDPFAEGVVTPQPDGCIAGRPTLCFNNSWDAYRTIRLSRSLVNTHLLQLLDEKLIECLNLNDAKVRFYRRTNKRVQCKSHNSIAGANLRARRDQNGVTKMGSLTRVHPAVHRPRHGEGR